MGIEATGCIRIIKIPSGNVPDDIRKAWLGLILPCYPHIGYIDTETFEISDAKEDDTMRRGVSIPQDEALAILETENPAAGAWWKEQGFPISESYFFFFEDEIEILGGVTEATLRVFDDMETGSWQLVN